MRCKKCSVELSVCGETHSGLLIPPGCGSAGTLMLVSIPCQQSCIVTPDLEKEPLIPKQHTKSVNTHLLQHPLLLTAAFSIPFPSSFSITIRSVMLLCALRVPRHHGDWKTKNLQLSYTVCVGQSVLQKRMSAAGGRDAFRPPLPQNCGVFSTSPKNDSTKSCKTPLLH